MQGSELRKNGKYFTFDVEAAIEQSTKPPCNITAVLRNRNVFIMTDFDGSEC